MVMPTVRAVHNWRNSKNKSGLYPVHLEIRIKAARRYYPISVPEKVSIAQWNGKEDTWVKPGHPFAFQINNQIREKKNAVNDLVKRYYMIEQSLSFSIIFKELKKKTNTNIFNDFFKDYIDHPTDKLEPDTFKKYRACLDHLNTFNKTVRFHDLTPDVIEQFYQHLVKVAKLAGSTIDSYFDAFRKVVGLARKAHQITKEHEESLFEDLHIEVKKSKRTYLTIEEIKAWKNIQFTEENKYLERDRDLFLLQIYTGFYYKDLINLKKEYLVNDHEYGYLILGERDKNDEQNIIPLFKFPDANSIIDKYASEQKDDPFVFRRDVFLAEPVYNRNLKKISPKAALLKSVSNKVARHSSAQLWIRLGVKKTVVSKMLGHAKEQTTDVYFRVNVAEVIDGTKHIDFGALGI